MQKQYALKGNIIYTKSFGKFETVKDGYIIVEDTRVKGVYQKLPEIFNNIQLIDHGNSLIIPGFVDLHLHAPQFANLGLGLDKELMQWLETYTFPEESKYSNIDYARKVYSTFIRELWKVGTTRACVFATLHKNATKLLIDLFDQSGLSAYVGKVNMDVNSPEYLIETLEDSILDTREILEEYSSKYELVKPIITPRFVPSCSIDLLKGLGSLAKEFNVPVQSHLCENYGEINFVRKLHPDYKDYASIYDNSGLFGEVPTVMAHCVLVDEEEIELMARKKVFVAHSPNSNCNLSSGIAPIRRLITRGIPVGLATDVSAGHSLSMNSVLVNASQVSNIKWLESGRVDKPLSTAELFYLATKGGGQFFGKVGSFEENYEFDALVIDDSSLSIFKTLTIEERLQKFIYTGDDRNIKERYVAGKKIEEPKCC
ncbi:guanine deaminase [Clostridium thailandense]|uniref:guanine deaminase n=1 Tax=Clostridium thailandense TaxID=2794346 RepID=UPI003989FB4C